MRPSRPLLSFAGTGKFISPPKLETAHRGGLLLITETVAFGKKVLLKVIPRLGMTSVKIEFATACQHRYRTSHMLSAFRQRPACLYSQVSRLAVVVINGTQNPLADGG